MRAGQLRAELDRVLQKRKRSLRLLFVQKNGPGQVIQFS